MPSRLYGPMPSKTPEEVQRLRGHDEMNEALVEEYIDKLYRHPPPGMDPTDADLIDRAVEAFQEELDLEQSGMYPKYLQPQPVYPGQLDPRPFLRPRVAPMISPPMAVRPPATPLQFDPYRRR